MPLFKSKYQCFKGIFILRSFSVIWIVLRTAPLHCIHTRAIIDSIVSFASSDSKAMLCIIVYLYSSTRKVSGWYIHIRSNGLRSCLPVNMQIKMMHTAQLCVKIGEAFNLAHFFGIWKKKHKNVMLFKWQISNYRKEWCGVIVTP